MKSQINSVMQSEIAKSEFEESKEVENNITDLVQN
jgi:hypothetical protein